MAKEERTFAGRIVSRWIFANKQRAEAGGCLVHVEKEPIRMDQAAEKCRVLA